MSNIINKVKDALSGHDHTADTTGATGTTHRTNRSGNSGVGTTTDTSATGKTAGPHRSDIANKIDPRVDSDRDGSRQIGTTGTTGKTTGTGGYGSHHESTNYGPHSTNLGNKVDPTVDSDLDSSRRATGGGAFTSGGVGTTGLGSGTYHTTSGPHDADLLNKADPRVDSDLDGSRNMGMRGTTCGTTGTTGTTGLSSTGIPYGTAGYGSNTGPHGSNVANKLDPRVDSDRDHRAAGTTGTYGKTGGVLGSGTYPTSTNYGPHSTNTANKLDPRIDSDRDHRGSGAPGYSAHGGPGAATTGTTHGTTHGTTTGNTYGVGHTGPAPHTVGPHKSDMMNKLDPRVDSDLDGSQTVGGNQNFAAPGSHHAERDTADAAQVPPSLFQKEYGTVTGKSKGDAF